MEKNKFVVGSIFAMVTLFCTPMITNCYAGLFDIFSRKNGLVHGSSKFKNVRNDPDEQFVRASSNRTPLKRNTFDEPPLRRSNFYRKDGLVNGEKQYRNRHLTEGDVKTVVFSNNGMVKSRVNVGFATNKRLKPISDGSFFDIFRSNSRPSRRQSIDSPR